MGMFGPSFKTVALASVLLCISGCNTVQDTGLQSSNAVEIIHVEEITIDAIHSEMKAGRLTAEQLTRSYLDRIAQLDQASHLNSIVVINPEALTLARQLDQEFAATGKLKPLHGIPIIVKDNYATKGLQTTAGSIALKGIEPDYDATQVELLKQAGAIVLAKSNMAEWAFSPSGTISSIGGLTRNPYDLTRVPAGSSGGTGAAVAANFGVVGLGTDTGNSIRGPSSHNGLVGFRTTMGLTSRAGIAPLYLRNDIGGPMARTVTDAVKILDVIAKVDVNDPITLTGEGKRPPAYTEFLQANGLEGLRIGVMRYYTNEAPIDDEVKALFEQALVDLQEQGASLVESFTIDGFSELIKDNWCNTFSYDINAFLQTLGDDLPFPTIQSVFESELYSVPIQKSLEYMVSNGKPPEECGDLYTRQRNVEFRNKVVSAMDAAKIDLMVFPTWSFPPREIADVDGHKGDNSQHVSPHTGLPTFTIPMGYTRGETLPAGLSFTARLFAEPTLIKATYAYEQATKHRKAPLL